MPTTAETLLKQIQQRFLALTKVEPQSQHEQDLRELLASLYYAQQTGNGVLLIDNVNSTLVTPIDELQHAFPALLGNTVSRAPITVFEPFIAFRRFFLQLSHVTEAIFQRQKVIPPNKASLQEIDWTFTNGGQLNQEQQLAAYSAASLPFCIITGGAGTGKTTTLIKALELILLDNPDTDILLAAPTGKAAQRLKESLQTQLECVSINIRESITNLQPQTLHRLLAISERSGRTFKNEHNPLACQVLAIDEASMISAELLEQVLSALTTDTKLILLGDANQLPPINAVAFFNDISQLTPNYTSEFAKNVANDLFFPLPDELINNAAPLANHICRLSIAQRFAEQSSIEYCANAVLNRDIATLTDALGHNLYPIHSANELYQQLIRSYPQNKEALLKSLSKRIILSANRQGQFGSQAINYYLDQHFHKILSTNINDEWYIGRSILIEKNYSDLQLSNGDIGRCIRKNNEWLIDFGNAHQLPVNALPSDYSLAFAITIHKSQGSEYQHIDMILDQFDHDSSNSLITVPLIYTAITRAKQSLSVYSDYTLLTATLSSTNNNQALSPLVHLLNTQSIKAQKNQP